ncbi:HAMP domain-containing sensor histidine kinase [Sphingomonas sp.]|uniref:sensor histidine kinase n=1 Tax=Sphingomonas sp. TaxID=28214 RepID=UPI0031D799CE
MALSGCALTLCGALILLAWRHGMFASVLGLALLILWLIVVACWTAARSGLTIAAPVVPIQSPADPPLHALLDQIPLPLIRLDNGAARAVNRAARTVFATDDRLRPIPAALLDPAENRLRHEARSWRIERIEAGSGRSIAMLIDIEAERRAAEAHADNEMIDILGHELLNGLSPIVSLADSALVAAERGDARLPAILTTLTRRIEGLERFTRAYRMLARLPDPARTPMAARPLADDLARLFAQCFGDAVALRIEVEDELTGRCDRDQMTQALWALLQNAAEAARSGAVAPSVTLAMAADREILCIRVTDSGDGVPAPERARIFRPFHTTKEDGSGIGLTLARRIARAHGGDLTLLPSAATTFEMTLPIG